MSTPEDLKNKFREEHPEIAAAWSRPQDPRGVCCEMSDGSIGWAIRIIKSVSGESVQLNDGVSFFSPCFNGARPGDIWAVKHEPGIGCFGQVRQAILLQPAGR